MGIFIYCYWGNLTANVAGRDQNHNWDDWDMNKELITQLPRSTDERMFYSCIYTSKTYT
jgi:hypothetical protein